jgi:hypothetical protein
MSFCLSKGFSPELGGLILVNAVEALRFAIERLEAELQLTKEVIGWHEHADDLEVRH